VTVLEVSTFVAATTAAIAALLALIVSLITLLVAVRMSRKTDIAREKSEIAAIAAVTAKAACEHTAREMVLHRQAEAR